MRVATPNETHIIKAYPTHASTECGYKAMTIMTCVFMYMTFCIAQYKQDNVIHNDNID